MSTLERAIAIAAEAHAGQTGKGGEAYVLHPLRVMLRLTSVTDRIVGVLHDVVEKNDSWTLSALRIEGFETDIIEAIDAVTRRRDEDYEAYVQRAAANEIGRRVKLADVGDKMKAIQDTLQSSTDINDMDKYRRAGEILVAPRKTHQNKPK